MTPDGNPACGCADAAVVRGELRARLLSEQQEYDAGYHHGYEAGLRDAHTEMAQWFAPVARLVRQRSGHPSFAARRAAEAEWVRPKPGDFTGALSQSEYFGTRGRAA